MYILMICSLCSLLQSLRGATQKETEEEMGVKIVFPSSKKEDSIGKFKFVVYLLNSAQCVKLFDQLSTW